MQYSLPLKSAQRETAVCRSDLINLDPAKPLIEETFFKYSLARDNINRSSNKQAAWPALTTLAADAAKVLKELETASLAGDTCALLTKTGPWRRWR
jgi:hypothetical protein